MSKQITNEWWFNALAGGVGSLVVAVAVGLMLKPVGHFLTGIPILGSGFAQLCKITAVSCENTENSTVTTPTSSAVSSTPTSKPTPSIPPKPVKFVIQPQFDDTFGFEADSELAWVKIGTLWGVIDIGYSCHRFSGRRYS